jgi:hypothetical protein
VIDVRWFRCSVCREMKPGIDFNGSWQVGGKRDTYCRPCRSAYHREHYQVNRSRYIKRSEARTRAQVWQRTKWLLEYFASHPCVDCGESDPSVLELDHRDELGPKAFNISRGIREHNWDSVLAEIVKCEVRCANCHRRRTAQQFGFVRAVLLTDGVLPAD